MSNSCQNETLSCAGALFFLFSTAEMFQCGLCAATSYFVADMKVESTRKYLVYLAHFLAKRQSPTLV